MSLRLRLSLLSVGFLVVLLLVGGAFQFFALGAQLRRDEAAVLDQRFAATVRSLTVLGSRGRACQVPAPASGAAPLTFTRAECISVALSGPQVTVMVVSPGGEVLSWDPVDATPPRLTAAAYQAAAAGRRRGYYLSGQGSDEQLVVLQPLRTATGKAVGVAQLSESTQPLQASQRGYLVVLAVATGALALIALLVLPLLVGRALRPLHRVMEASAALARGELGRRVEAPPGQDELGRLAHAFNDMAIAVQAAFQVRTDSEAGMRRFVADASHELRTPLTTLQGRLDLLSRGTPADPDIGHQQLTAMQADLRRMSGLVEDLLTLTRLDAATAGGAERGHVTRVDVDDLIAETVEELSVRAPQQRIDVEAGARGTAVVLGDREQLRRVILNLANNALNHAPGGIHTWRSSATDGWLTMSLGDSGPGFPATDLPRVFDRFYRGQAEAHSAPGSGLGLAIVRSIVEASGGSVSAGNGGLRRHRDDPPPGRPASARRQVARQGPEPLVDLGELPGQQEQAGEHEEGT